MLHQQEGGDRENITSIVTICADGTDLPPAIIFKGECFQTHWKQDNPLNASIGHSKKGYTDGTIGVEWIQQLDDQTHDKAAGRRRLLILDGHNSHYTRAFLEYARTHRIVVICYPSHSTHIYQGLDVVIFGVLKRRWTESRLAYERRTNKKVDKRTFLSVYAEAHTRAVTKENILAAFRKTGIVPLNRNAITEEMLAPSIPSSSRGVLPLPQASPIRAISDMIERDIARRVAHLDGPMELDQDERHTTPLTPSRPRPSPHVHTPVRLALDELRSTSAAFLVTKTPPHSSTKPCRFTPYKISPWKPRSFTSLDSQFQDLTPLEAQLLSQLRQTEDQCKTYKTAMVGMQAQMILDGMYVSKVQGHLQGHEESMVKKKEKNRRFGLGDGHAKLLTGDAFYRGAVEAEEEAKRREAEKEERKRRNLEYADVLIAWKATNDARQSRNEKLCHAYQDAVKAWEAEHEYAKLMGQKPKPLSTKPKRGPLEPRVVKPKKVVQDEEYEDDDASEHEDDADR